MGVSLEDAGDEGVLFGARPANIEQPDIETSSANPSRLVVTFFSMMIPSLDSNSEVRPPTTGSYHRQDESFTVEKFLVLGRFSAQKPKFLDSERLWLR